jgi:hypothetical protein
VAAKDVDGGLSRCPVVLGCRQVAILPGVIASPRGGLAGARSGVDFIAAFIATAALIFTLRYLRGIPI